MAWHLERRFRQWRHRSRRLTFTFPVGEAQEPHSPVSPVGSNGGPCDETRLVAHRPVNPPAAQALVRSRAAARTTSVAGYRMYSADWMYSADDVERLREVLN